MAAEGRGLISFLYSFGLAYLAAALLASAAGHVLRFPAFHDLVRVHAIVPQRLSGPAALCVLSFELAAATTALLLAWRDRVDLALAVLLCGTTLIAGLGFLSYVRRLLRSGSPASCGCSPLAGPTTAASAVPAAALVVISAVTLAAAVVLAAAPSAAVAVDGVVGALPQLWGVTVAVGVMLVPASAPAASTRETGP